MTIIVKPRPVVGAMTRLAKIMAACSILFLGAATAAPPSADSSRAPETSSQGEPQARVPQTVDALADTSLLDEYEKRLFPQHPCTVDQSCSQAQKASLGMSGGRLVLVMEIHAMARSVYPLPSLGGAQWAALGKEAKYLRAPSGDVGLLVEEGLSRVELSMEPTGSEVVISFASPPNSMSIDVPGWRSEMPSKGAIPSVKLSKAQARIAEEGAKAGTNAKKPADEAMGARFEAKLFIDESRHARFDANGADVETTFKRLSPSSKPASASMELMPGEKIVSEGVASNDGKSAKIDFPAGVSEVVVATRWEYRQSMELAAHGQADRRETWVIDPWSKAPLKFEGLVPVNAAGNSASLIFMPKPGEKLSMLSQRILPEKGAQIAIDRSDLAQTTGEDRVDHAWSIQARSTIAAPLEVRVPASWRVDSSSVNGRPAGLSKKGGGYVVDLVPGSNLVSIVFSQPRDAWWWVKSPAIALGAPSANLKWTLMVPQNQWVVWTSGPLMGPAILIWGVLAAMGALSYALSKTLKSPFAPSLLGWLCILIPLSALSPWTGLVLVAFVFALASKEKNSHLIRAKDWNGIQLGLMLLGSLSFFILLAAVYQGLLGEPDMMVRGPDTFAGKLAWYQDKASMEGPMSQGLSAGALLAPIWLWRALMLGWALWIAAAVAKRLPPMWTALCLGGFWRKEKK